MVIEIEDIGNEIEALDESIDQQKINELQEVLNAKMQEFVESTTDENGNINHMLIMMVREYIKYSDGQV